MKFVDEATIEVQAGRGGDGSASMRREKYVPFGGPDGGDGGRGGDVYLQAATGINTLVDFNFQKRFKAGSGVAGSKRQWYGKDGEDCTIKVPLGTIVRDFATDECIGDIVKPGQKLLVAKGGDKGLGNVHFKTSTNRAPRKTTKGKPGDIRKLKLELSVLADVGLLGMPNAGKSTFIRKVSHATPKVADYPFTTLYPNLGTVILPNGNRFVVADIPGLIPGAHKGAGLGIMFLKHLRRTRLLLHIVDVSVGLEEAWKDYQAIQHELLAFDPDLAHKECWVLLNKKDCLDLDVLEEIEQHFKSKLADKPCYCIAAVAKDGIEELLPLIAKELEPAE